MKEKEVIEIAVSLIRAQGWHQGYPGFDEQKGEQGPICMGIALNIALRNTVLPASSSAICHAIGDAIAELFPDRTSLDDIPGFNDDPHTSREDVFLVMKHAKERL